MVEGKVAEVVAAGCHEILLLGRQREHGFLSQFQNVTEGMAQPSARSIEHCRSQRSSNVRRDEVAERPRALEFAIGHQCGCGSVRSKTGAEVPQIVEPVKQQPRPEPGFFSQQLACRGNSAPDDGTSIALRPDGDDAWSPVPAP